MDINENIIKKEISNSQYSRVIALLEKIIEHVDDFDAILKETASHYDADRAYVFEYSEDRKTINNLFEWCREGIEPQIDILQNVPSESVEAWEVEFRLRGAFYISSLDDDVEANSLTYEILEPQGINSLLAAPIYRDDILIGFIGVDNPRINTDDVVILKIAAGVLYSEIIRKISLKNEIIMEMKKAQIKQKAELGEIRDIISSANMGTWRIELVDGVEPKMFVDDTMKRLLGIEGKDRTPERIYDEWFYNITPEAVSSVLNSVERMEQGYFDENTYLWQHPTKGVRYVRCGGTAKPIENGYSLQGYHYDVDDVVRKNNAQMLKLRKALEDKKEYYDTLGALGDLFYSMHVIDLEKDTANEFIAKNEVREIVSHREGAAQMMIDVMRAVVDDEHLESALEYTDLTTLADRMCKTDILSREFVGKNIGWFVASFIMMEKDDAEKPTKVIFTSRSIDKEKKQQETLIYKSQTDEMTGLLNRRAYEEMIYEHNDVPEEDNFIYMSIDANGLKVINDTKGHAAGDELLIGVAQCMKRSLGSYGHLFRTGGDEFIAILFCSENKISHVLEDFDNMVKNWKGNLIDSFTVSYGWVNKNEFPDATTRQLSVIAEKRMYEDKSKYYRRQGVDRRGQQDSHRVLCELYTKILRINISDDSYQIINMDPSEQDTEKGFSEKLSEWLVSFGKKGLVHPDDLDEYLRLTDLNYMKEYFDSGKTSLHIFYRRKYEDGFKQVMTEVVPTKDYSENDMNLFLYVKNIDKL